MTLGMMNSNAAPVNMQKTDSKSPRSGTFNDDSLPSARGAALSRARPNSILLVEKPPLFADERAEISTTKFTTAAAAGRPASANRPTNGILSGEIYC